MSKNRIVFGFVAFATVLGVTSLVSAAPYASGVTVAGNDVTFVLNQDAANVTLMLDGGGTQDLGAMAAGAHTVTVPSVGNHQIKVTNSAAAGWTQVVASDTAHSFYSPMGVSINRNKTSSNYGSVYVSNAKPGTTAFGRVTADGVYSLRADGAALNKDAAGVVWGGSSGPWKSAVGTDDRVYVTDLSNDLVYDMAPDLASAIQLNDATNRTTNQWVGGVTVVGTQAAGNRQIYLANVNYSDNARKGLIKYDLGGNATMTSGDTGTQYIGPSYYSFYPYDYVRDSAGDWYDVQYRYDATQAPAISKFADSAELPINTAVWATPKAAPYNGGYCLDLYEEKGWVAYGNYYDGFVHIFNMADGSYVGGFDTGTRVRDIAFDAAGNIYTVDELSEWLKVWSPGGDTMMETPFTIVPEPATMLLLGVSALFLRRRRA